MEWPFYVKYGKDLEKSSTIKKKCTTFITVQGIQNQQNIIQQCVITTFPFEKFLEHRYQICSTIVSLNCSYSKNNGFDWKWDWKGFGTIFSVLSVI